MISKLSLAATAVWLAACARVPVEVRTAMEKQGAELTLIRQSQRQSVDILFDQIRALQHYILDDLERGYQAKYARGPKPVTVGGEELLVYTDKDGKGLPPSYDADLDVIPVSTNRIITDWFRCKRTDSDQKLETTKSEFLKLEGHVQIAETINEAVTQYLDSLVNLRSKQKELGQTLIQKIGAIQGLTGIQASALSLFKIDTAELDSKLPKPGAAQQPSPKAGDSKPVTGT